jgi:hypothetical protein
VLLASSSAIDAFVLVATPGRPLRTVIREQLVPKVDAATLLEVDRLLSTVAAGRPIDNVPAGLEALFNPSSGAYLHSEIDIDPAARLSGVSVPVTIVQGDTDVQVSTEDARLLGEARHAAKVKVLHGVNHVLKEESKRVVNQTSYTDPTRPLASSAMEAIASGIAK